MKVAFFDAKPFDRKSFLAAEGAAGIEWRFHEFHLSAATAALAAGCDAVCVFVNDHVDRACLEALRAAGVGLVALRASGFNNVDLEAARALGVAVARVPAYSPNAVAEYTLGLVLTLNRKIHRAYNRVRDLNFSLEGLVGFDVAGKSVGVIGTGKIGRLVAEIFRGIRAEVVAFDPRPDAEWAKANGVRYDTLEHALTGADIVTLHVPLLLETYHLINALTLSKMKPGAILVNTSRGQLVDTSALIEALKSGRLGGVALDVYEEEEGVFYEDRSGQVLQDDELARLLSFPNVLITSHQAFLTREALANIARVTIDNLTCFATGRPLPKENVL